MANVVIHHLQNQTIETVSAKQSEHFEYFWKVSWDIPKGQEQIQELLTEPKADLFIEQESQHWQLSQIRTVKFKINLKGKSSVFGIKLQPATESIFLNQLLLLPLIDFQKDFSKNVAIIEEYLLKTLPVCSKEMKLVNSIIKAVSQKPSLTLSQIQEQFNLDSRKLQRLFQKHLGLRLKWILCRYRTLEAIQQSKVKEFGWAEISQNLGYSDQAHFIRDFKRNCGLTPQEYFNLYQKGLST